MLMPEYINAELFTVMSRELIGSGLLVILGIVQLVLSFRLAREVKSALELIGSPMDSDAEVRKMWRPVHGFRILALLSFLVAMLSIAIPLSLYVLYQC